MSESIDSDSTENEGPPNTENLICSSDAVDLNALNDIESHTKRLAEQCQRLLSITSTNLQKDAALASRSVASFENSVEMTADIIDASIKQTYSLISKCEELSNLMKSVHIIKAEVDFINKLLTQFEQILAKRV